MAKATLERNTFVKGLITEASPLTFPENASIEEENFVLNRDGSRRRRKGMDYENSYALINTGYANSNFSSTAISSFLWKNVGEDNTTTVTVIQVGRKLHFLDAGTQNPTANVLGTLTLDTRYENSPFQYTAIKGVLVLVNSADEFGPSYVEYDGTTFTRTPYEIKVRDIWGVDDDLEVDELLLSAGGTVEQRTFHAYNTFNQGWTYLNYSAVDTYYGSKVTNSEVMHLAKDSSENFDASLLRKQFFGNTPAAKGKCILNVYTRGADREAFYAQVSGGPSPVAWRTDKEEGRISTAASYAGRVFYAGISSDVTGGDANTPNYSGTIFFTQIIDGINKLGKCYQEADPTSEHISDLLSSDGGSVNIPEATQILRLINKGSSLVVLAENGVWEISGRDGVFAADDFFVHRVTNVGAIGTESIINVEDNIFYWSDGGIYILTPDQSSGRLQASNISESTIQTHFTDIPSVGRLYAKGNYDPTTRKVSWLYNDSEDYDGTTQVNKYNKELIFDTVLQAFYTYNIYSLASNSPYVSGYIQVTEFLNADRVDNILVNGVQVQVNGEDVVVTTPVRTSGTGITKYITIVPDSTDNKLTLSFYKETTFKDWYTEDNVGVDAYAYLVTGYELFQDSQRRKYIPYLTTHFRRSETGFTDLGGGNLTPTNPSSCMIQTRWDFSDSSASGKWGTPFQAYRLKRNYMPSNTSDEFDYGYTMVSTKNRLRGSGRAFSMKIYTEAGKECHLYGWAMLAEGNTSV